MRNLQDQVVRFLRSEDGPTAVEYAVMLALIIVASVSIISSLGGTISSTFGGVSTGLPAAS